MVIQSDLDVIVKSSRDEVFVFAENMLSGKPWPGVRLLISNGHAVIGEGTTDAHGVFQKNYRDLPWSAPAKLPCRRWIASHRPSKRLHRANRIPRPASGCCCWLLPLRRLCHVPCRPTIHLAECPPHCQKQLRAPASGRRAAGGAVGVPNDIRVFAVVGNNVASNMLDLQGVGVAQGLTDKGYIYSDRPAYRAGQLVNIRGCLRRAVNDAYTVDKRQAVYGRSFRLPQPAHPPGKGEARRLRQLPRPLHPSAQQCQGQYRC